MAEYRMHVWAQTQSRRRYHRPRVPSKADGRRGTRRAWKRRHPPGVYPLIYIQRSDGTMLEYFDL